MAKTKGAKDKKPRKKETKVRDTFGYVLSMYRRKNGLPNDWQFSTQEEKILKIKWLWRQLDCIRRTPDFKVVGKKGLYISPPRSRVVLKRPVPAEKGKYSVHWYRRRVSRMMVYLFGEDISNGLGNGYLPSPSLPTSWRWAEQRRFVLNVLWTAVCRMMEKENAEKAEKRPIKTEQQVIDELEKLGVPVPKIKPFYYNTKNIKTVF